MADYSEIGGKTRSPRKVGCTAGIIIAIIILVILPLISGIINYNRFVKFEKQADESWANVESQLKRRSDLIPNLVSTVKAYAKYEKEVFIEVTRARSRLDNAKGPQEVAQANSGLNQALSRLMVVVENYPQLKANENFLQLQAQLEGTENRLQYAREKYNQAVKKYNTSIKRFPGVLFARMFGFEEREFFEAAPAERETPDVGKMLEE